jgi:hypothetical protein
MITYHDDDDHFGGHGQKKKKAPRAGWILRRFHLRLLDSDEEHIELASKTERIVGPARTEDLALPVFFLCQNTKQKVFANKKMASLASAMEQAEHQCRGLVESHSSLLEENAALKVSVSPRETEHQG